MNSDISDLLSRGIELGREGSWEEASGLLRQVVVKDARNVEAWLWLGAMADDPLESVTYLERALEINPRSIRAQKGLDWAREKQAGPAVTETATHQSSTLSSAVDAEPGSAAGNLDWPLPATDAPAIQPEATALQIPPGVSDGQSLDDKEDDKEVAAGWSDEQLSPQESVIPEFGGEKDDSFSGEGRSPLSLDDDDFVSPPARPEATSSGSVELPKAILSAFQFDDEIGSEENPLSASSLDDVAGDFGPTGSNLPTGEQSPPASWDGTANLDEYFSKSPLLDQNASEKGADSFNMLARDGSEPGQEPVNQTSLDVNEAAAPLESWDAIIARLRALDGQIKNEPEDPWTGGDTTGAQAGDLETLPAGIDKLAPSSASANDEQVLADQSGEVAPDTMEAGVKSMPVEPGLDEKISALVEKAKLDTEAGNLTEAIEGLNEALSLDPDRVEANEQFGIVQYQAGNLDAAMSAFETVVRLKPDQAEGHANLGFLFAEKGATNAAIASFGEALKRDPALLEAHLGLADLYKAQDNMDGAIEQWSEAVRLRADLNDVRLSLGEAYAGRGQLGEAIREYRLLVERKPDDARVHLRLGQIHYQNGEVDNAAKEYRAALQIASALPEAHYGLASCLEDQGNREAADSELEKALAIKPDYLEATEKLASFRAAITPTHEDDHQEALPEEKVKKSRWGFFGRDKK